jgi:hypothetical protein
VFEDSNVLGLGKTKEAKLVGFSKNQNPLKETKILQDIIITLY